MSDYSPVYDGAAKDLTDDPILGAEFDTEFDAIATMSATKANKIGSATSGNLISQDANGDLVDSGVNKDNPSVTSVTATTVNATTVDLGDWTITESAGTLKFAYQGTNRFSLSSAGALTVENDITAFGNA